MTLHTELFWSIRSPYSYLVIDRVAKACDEYDLHVDLKPVYPLAVRKPEFFTRADPRWLGYITHDFQRVAEYLNLPCGGWPRPDPIVQDRATGQIAPKQPYIRRLTHLLVDAQEQGCGIAFAQALGRLLWGGAHDDWNQEELLARVAQESGLDWEAMKRRCGKFGDRYEAALQANEDDLDQSGHWGVPTFRFRDELFFGQDRFDVWLWRMRQHGLVSRHNSP